MVLTESFGYSRLQEDIPHTSSGGGGGGGGRGGGRGGGGGGGGGGEMERDSYDTNTHMEGDTTYNTEEGGIVISIQ